MQDFAHYATNCAWVLLTQIKNTLQNQSDNLQSTRTTQAVQNLTFQSGRSSPFGRDGTLAMPGCLPVTLMIQSDSQLKESLSPVLTRVAEVQP